ncbi:MAG: sugar transferase [Spirochaetaceae bacterium]|nr:sugar transferase [Spirochaetaceae bacterium]
MKNKINRSLLFLLAWIVFGVILVTSLASFFVYNTFLFWNDMQTRTFISISIIIYLLFSIFSLRINRFSYREQLGLVLFILSLCMSVFLTIIAIGRLYYSRSYLVYYYVFSFIWTGIGFYFFKNPKNSFFLLCPWGLSLELSKSSGRKWEILKTPQLKNCDGIIADLHEKIEPEWMRMIANATLINLPVYHAATIYEKTTGKISTSHLNEGLLSTYYKVNIIYFRIKSILEKLLIILFSPFLILTIILVSIIVKIDSKGPVFFIQDRVGRKGKSFRMYKFRSMIIESEKDGAKFTSTDDKRITKIGNILRKYRIDEIPQFFNILKGEMSLIGPRPEQVVFSDKFEKEIPFYAYRHLVNPGITGWAQVNHGYAAGTEETETKLEYDLYYVKYMGFWIDLLIILKTLKTILTGFGSK